MRICRFTTFDNRAPRFGLLQDNEVMPCAEGVTIDNLSTAPRGKPLSVEQVQFIAPVAPSKIVCVGRNYREHAAELGNKMPVEPLLFLKAPSAVIGNGDCIVLPSQSEQVEHEGELGVVIGRRARNVSEDEALNYVWGYTCVNDVTARDLQRKDVQFTRGKSFDSFCPVGPSIVSGLDPRNLQVTTRLNGTIKQNGHTADMAFPVPFLIHYISHIMTLLPGDLIATGTPAGVSAMTDGDVVEVEIQEIGTLRNAVCGPRKPAEY